MKYSSICCLVYSVCVLLLINKYIFSFVAVDFVKSKISAFDYSNTNTTIKKDNDNYKFNHEFGIHTQIILKENILFIEEWIKHHQHLGFTSFVFYDNTGSHREGNGVNKYKIEFDELITANDTDINRLQANIIKSFTDIHINFIKDYGNFSQVDSIIDYVQHYHNKVKWTAFIDVDEFIITKISLESYVHLHSQYQKFVIWQVKFPDRWCYLEKAVTSINTFISNLPSNWAPKSIIMTNVINVSNIGNIHSIGIFKLGSWFNVQINDIWFNHYNVNQFEIEWMKWYFNQKTSFKWCKNDSFTQIKRVNLTTINKINYIDTEIYDNVKKKHCNFIPVNNSEKLE
eukprot:48562_1